MHMYNKKETLIIACEAAPNQRESLIPPTADPCQLIPFILTMNSFH